MCPINADRVTVSSAFMETRGAIYWPRAFASPRGTRAPAPRPEEEEEEAEEDRTLQEVKAWPRAGSWSRRKALRTSWPRPWRDVGA